MEEQKINIEKISIIVMKNFFLKPIFLPIIIWKQMAINMSLENYEERNSKDIIVDFPIITWIIILIDSLIILSYPLGLFIALYNTLTSEFGNFNLFLKIVIYFFFSPLFLKFFKEMLKIFILVINKLTNFKD